MPRRPAMIFVGLAPLPGCAVVLNTTAAVTGAVVSTAVGFTSSRGRDRGGGRRGQNPDG